MAVFPDGCGVTPQRPGLIAPSVSRLDTAASIARAHHVPAERSALIRHKPQPLRLRAAASPSKVTAFPDERRSIPRPKPPLPA
jgi:hypothetical protein